MSSAEDLKKKLQSDKSARDKFAADIAGVLQKHGVSIDASKVSSQLEGGGAASAAAAWAVSIVSG
jgi:hypothetical protein